MPVTNKIKKIERTVANDNGQAETRPGREENQEARDRHTRFLLVAWSQLQAMMHKKS